MELDNLKKQWKNLAAPAPFDDPETVLGLLSAISEKTKRMKRRNILSALFFFPAIAIVLFVFLQFHLRSPLSFLGLALVVLSMAAMVFIKWRRHFEPPAHDLPTADFLDKAVKKIRLHQWLIVAGAASYLIVQGAGFAMMFVEMSAALALPKKLVGYAFILICLVFIGIQGIIRGRQEFVKDWIPHLRKLETLREQLCASGSAREKADIQ